MMTRKPVVLRDGTVAGGRGGGGGWAAATDRRGDLVDRLAEAAGAGDHLPAAHRQRRGRLLPLAQTVRAGHRDGTSSFRWRGPLDVVIRTIVRYAPNTAAAVVTMRRKAVIAIIRINAIISVTSTRSGHSCSTTVPASAVTTRDRYAIACPAHHQSNTTRRDTRLRIVHRRTAPTGIAGRRIQRYTGTSRVSSVQQQRIQHAFTIRPNHVDAAASAAVLTTRSTTQHTVLIVHDVLEYVEAKVEDNFALVQPIRQVMPKQQPVVRDRKVQHLGRIQRLVNDAVRP